MLDTLLDILHWIIYSTYPITVSIFAWAYLTENWPMELNLRVPWRKQSRVLRMEGTSEVRVGNVARDPIKNKADVSIFDNIRTLYECIRNGVKLNGDGPCLGTRQGDRYEWVSYKEALQKCRDFASGLVSLGMKPGNNTFIGIYCRNCPEWALTEQACFSQSMVLVPLYDTLGSDACNYIINQVQIGTVIVENTSKAELLLKDPVPCVRIIISVDSLAADTKHKAQGLGISVYSFRDVEALGSKKPVEDLPPKQSDICTISYTSGTTGNPKGVILSHSSVIHAIRGAHISSQQYAFNQNDVMISYLPLAHLIGRETELTALAAGTAIGYFSGDMTKVLEDIKVLRPTVLPAVPRIFNKIRDKIITKVNQSPPVKKFIFKIALANKARDLRKGIIRKDSVWDKLVFRKIQAEFGGRIRFSFVGAAPSSKETLTFMRCILGVNIVEAYGQTESGGPVMCTVIGDPATEHVGIPLEASEIKLVDVPDMKYFAERNKGEICIRGPTVFQGYFKDPQNTKETIDRGGWLHTGDIGQWLPNGTLRIIDRKKNIFKLSQGEYIAPEKIEQIYSKSSYIDQIFVHGNSLQSFLVAVIVPELEAVRRWATKNGIKKESLPELCAEGDLQNEIRKDMARLEKEAKLKGFEKVKQIKLHPEPFTPQNGLVTPTMKVKRGVVMEKFKREIEQMYSLMVST